MDAKEIIALAAEYASRPVEMQSSAKLCLADAENLLSNGNEVYAKQRALKSLQYSVGVLSPIYKDAAKDIQDSSTSN